VTLVVESKAADMSLPLRKAVIGRQKESKLIAFELPKTEFHRTHRTKAPHQLLLAASRHGYFAHQHHDAEHLAPWTVPS
jgi:hypothetical protein